MLVTSTHSLVRRVIEGEVAGVDRVAMVLLRRRRGARDDETSKGRERKHARRRRRQADHRAAVL
jgi:hypothetical protein